MTIQTIQLNKLALSDLNVRKVKPKEIEALAADIQARGVLQNLIGYDEDGKIKICAGGRRYRALKLLQKAKRGLSSNGTENLHKARLQASSMPVTLGSRSGRSSPRATMSGMVKA